MAYRIGVTEFDCEVCVEVAGGNTSQRSGAVVNKGDLCVDLKGAKVEISRLSSLRPELACLPKMRLCAGHLRSKRSKGGEWVTIEEAAVMLSRKDKKQADQQVVSSIQLNGDEKKSLNRLFSTVTARGGGAINPRIIFRKMKGE